MNKYMLMPFLRFCREKLKYKLIGWTKAKQLLLQVDRVGVHLALERICFVSLYITNIETMVLASCGISILCIKITVFNSLMRVNSKYTAMTDKLFDKSLLEDLPGKLSVFQAARVPPLCPLQTLTVGDT